MNLLTEIQLFPPVTTWALALKCDVWHIEAAENYQKGSYRNRYWISGPNGKIMLSVPLEKGKNAQKPIREVRISNEENWPVRHLRTLRTSYGRSPFFEDYFPYFEALFASPPDTLFDFNLKALKVVKSLIAPDLRIKLTREWREKYGSGDTLDLRDKLNSTKNSSSLVEVNSYAQVFEDKHGFIPNLSILDLLFCAGPESRVFLK